MSRPDRPKKPTRKQRKRRRATLKLAANGLAPTLVTAQLAGVEATALAAARALGLAHAGFVPSGTKNPGDTYEATPTRHPSQPLKWNVRFAEATVVITPDAVLHGRARLAVEWCRRYRKPWLHLFPGSHDGAQLAEWLRTRPLKSLHLTGALAHQAERLGDLVEAFVHAFASARGRPEPAIKRGDAENAERS
ncbi:MAG: hypothetical protein JNL89_15470 [Rhodanobacteraceae bacterium]|nr:hypothetical protein [Rhodanobacteraceae bacterium]